MPLPALRTRKALAAAEPGTRLVVDCTDPMSVIDTSPIWRRRPAVASRAGRWMTA